MEVKYLDVILKKNIKLTGASSYTHKRIRNVFQNYNKNNVLDN